MKNFGKTVCKIAIPVTLQSMLQSSFSIIDQLMIGQLGENSIAAVGLGGNFCLIYSVVLGAIATVAGVLIAQFLGAADEKEAWRGFSVSMLSGLCVAALFTLVSLFFAEPILGLYTPDTQTILEGTPYLRIISFTFLPMAISTVIATWLRCSEHATLPLVASFMAVLVNTSLNFVLIFGKLGLPALGAVGAGCATVISQLVNLLLMGIGFFWCIRKDHRKIIFSIHLQHLTLGEYFAMIFPILISEFLWSLGQNVNSAVYGHLGTDSLAAYTLTTPIQGMFCGALSGLSAAAGVMIGKQLGKADYDEAYRDSKKLLWLSFFSSLVLSAVLILLSGYYVGFYPVEESVGYVAKLLLYVFALYAPVKVLNMVLGGGIIRSGGNTKLIMIIDIIGTWCVGVPLLLFAAYVLKLSIVPVYAILTFEEVVRLVITMVVFMKKTWMRSLHSV